MLPVSCRSCILCSTYQHGHGHTSFKDAGQSAGAPLQMEADVQIKHMREGVVSNAPARCLRDNAK